MKNSIDNITKNIISIKVSGRNIYNYINKLIKQKIPIYNLNIIDRKTAIIKINYSDFIKLKKNNYLYELDMVNYHGRLKFKKYIKKNYILYLSLILGLIMLKILSNIIFNIEVIHSNLNIRSLIYKELENNNIKKLTFKKRYNELEKIEENILNNNKDKLEWIEINVVGTKYVVKVTERKIKDNNKENKNQNIVASKNAIITKIISSKGVINKSIGDYVLKGDVLISGVVTLPNGTNVIKTAEGKVYGEVWYTVDINHPYIYKEETLTGKNKEIVVLKFLNKRLSFFDFHKYKTYKSSEKVLINSNFSLIRLVKEKQYELKIIDENYTKEQLIDKMINTAKEKISSKLDDIEYIKSHYVLESEDLGYELKLKIFFSVVENISEEQLINENLQETN